MLPLLRIETPISEPSDIPILESDIDAVVHAFGWNFEEHHRSVLTCKATQDIQACPGSGKTTLLVAKLAILAKKWHWGDRGICVLSHTNVARNEIEKRLANDPVGCKLLNYPHFIGTIQVFVDQFLAYPYLLNRGINIVKVDDHSFAKRATNYVRQHSDDFKYYFNGHKDVTKGWEIIKGIRYGKYSAPKFTIFSTGGTIPGENSKTYQTLKKMKNDVAGAGIFCYEDMFAFAEAYIQEYPSIIEYIQIRFPWVFMDEMQDTHPRQNSLLCKLFCDKSIVQRFGDINQGIFGETDDFEDELDFPVKDHLELPVSQRFGQNIANFASTLTAKRRQMIVGNLKKYDSSQIKEKHTIFLFDSTTITSVLENFSNLIYNHYPDGVPDNFTAKAIGFRKSVPDSSNSLKLPFNIGSYWPDFQPDLGSVNVSRLPEYLIDFVRLARYIRQEKGELKEAHDWLIRGILEFMHRQDKLYYPGQNKRRISRNQLNSQLNDLDEQAKNCFTDLLSEWCLSDIELTGSYWKHCIQTFLNAIARWINQDLTSEANEFLHWRQNRSNNLLQASKLSKELSNFFICNKYSFPIKIELTTIHAVKGETHDATLVLETFFNKSYDLQMLIPFLIGKGNYDLLATDKKLLGHMKRVFVAVTRPRELLCLALHKDHVNRNQINGLEKAGWQVAEVINP